LQQAPVPRRNSVATFSRLSKGDMQELGFCSSLSSLREEDEFQHLDYNDEDSCSVCSEATDLEFCDIDDPSDWFLEEEVEDAPKFVILEKEQLQQRQEDVIELISTHLYLSLEDTALVLQYFNWDTERLLRVYFDDPELYLRESGLVVPPRFSSSQFPQICPICMDEVPFDKLFALGCGHYYCVKCWRDYLHEATFSAGPEILNVTCMYPQCPAKLNNKAFKSLADNDDYVRHCYFLLKHFAESDRHILYCPNPGCGNAVLYQGDDRPTDVVECHCGTRFCFSCGHEKHNPVTCDQLADWLKQLQDDSESMAVIKATSKPCYHCGTATERVTGCNHMVCRKEMGGCGGEWCWMCRGDWKTHSAHSGGFYSCNGYDQSEAKKFDEESREYLQTSRKFLHYFNRYFNHDLLMKNTLKYEGEVEAKMRDFMDVTGCCPDFYMEAVEMLIECRRMLKYTYVYGYYLEDGPGKVLFEYQQASAEGTTERLAELFHAPVEVIAEAPLDFVNYIRVAKKYISNLIKSIEEGLPIDTNSESAKI